MFFCIRPNPHIEAFVDSVADLDNSGSDEDAGGQLQGPVLADTSELANLTAGVQAKLRQNNTQDTIGQDPGGVGDQPQSPMKGAKVIV